MKKHLLLLSLLVTSHLFSQITLNENTSTPIIGDTVLYKHIIIQNEDILENETGANQLWNYSNLDYSSVDSTEYLYTESSTSNYLDDTPLDFSNSDMMCSYTNSFGDLIENFYNISPNEFSFIGDAFPSFWGGADYSYYPTGLNLLNFPITYNDSYTDTILGNNSDDQDLSVNQEITADGYGDLILPYDTINNVLRVKVKNIITTKVGLMVLCRYSLYL